METVRERIIRALLESPRPLTARQLGALAGAELTPSEVYGELEHVRRTLKR
ncbi:MAG: transcriptional regulator, partial [Thermoproteaceae archaeon]|nr:transcriptional regulator [Thermoproteaceae archaeon]